MDRTLELGTQKEWRLLAKYSIPAVIATMVNAIYNIVDRIFIGKFAGETALAGLTIAFPVMMILFAFIGLVNIGNAALLSIRFGEKDRRGASHVFCNSLSLMLIIMLVIVTVIYLNFDFILSIFGAEADVLVQAKNYLKIILIGTFFQSFAFTLNGTVRTEGHPKLSMAAMSASGVTNIILDYFFVAVLGWGVEGAAIATIIGMFVGLGILIVYFLKGNSSLHINLKDFVPDRKVVRSIFAIGLAAFLAQVGTSVSMTLLNRGLAQYGGTSAIAAMGAINSLFTLFIMPMFGLQEGLQPIIGYNYGAGKLRRSYKTFKIAAIVSVVFATFVFSMMQLFPKMFVGLFLNSDSESFSVAVRGLRIYILMLPLLGINFMGITFFQSTNNGKVSTLLGMLRHFLVLIPVLIILPGIFGLDGVWFSVPVADLFSIIVAAVMLLIYYRRDKKQGKLITTEA